MSPNAASTQRALVPVKKLSPPAVIEKNRDLAPLDLVNGNLSLSSREEVKKLLPDIMGKALARIWIDSDFHRDFSSDPQSTLEKNGVYLPETMIVEFQKPNSDRPRIVVYERRPGSKFKVRVFYLQLVMMAGR
ncbi:MAG: hypothetical protein P8L82_02695 [Paracoccaceae bacterium]|nr:hypothetical protein [Paracoccaceae bacterium]